MPIEGFGLRLPTEGLARAGVETGGICVDLFGIPAGEIRSFGDWRRVRWCCRRLLSAKGFDGSTTSG
jgi:hypothetical protein